LFVASFVGTANILPARPNGSAVRIAETFDLQLPAPLVTGPGSLVVRPEGVRLHGAGDADGIAGTVRAVTLLGATLRVEVEIAGGARVLADVPHNGTEPGLRHGDAVRVTLEAARIVFIPE
jgi:ABC-type Fe3+/spermidine/putrescine transport system ATPase subunit